MSTYRQFKDIDPTLFRGMLLGEDTTETTTDSQNEDGIMSRTTPSATPSTEQTGQEDLLVTTAQTMANASTDREALANAIVPPTPELRPQDFDIGEWETLRPIEDVLSSDPMYDMAKEDAQVQAAITSARGITRSRTEPAGSGEVLTDVDPIKALDTPEVEETELPSDSAGLMSRPEPAAEETEEEPVAVAAIEEETSFPEPFEYTEEEEEAISDRKNTIERLGSSFDEASVDDVKVLQRTLRDMAGPTKVNVGAIDGLWGAMGRNALWAFQLRAGIPPTGEMNEETAKALNSPADFLDKRSSDIDASTLDSASAKMLVGVEALRLMPYELNSSKEGRSGLTFGAGIDVGQHTADYLKNNFNFTDEMIEDFGVYDPVTRPDGWIGRNPASPNRGGQGGASGTAARNRVHNEMAEEYRRQREAGELPVVPEKWIVDNLQPVYDQYVSTPKAAYNRLYGDGAWDQLPEEAQAVAVLENYRGDGVNNEQLRLLNQGDYIAAANAARKGSRSPAMVKILREYGHES